MNHGHARLGAHRLERDLDLCVLTRLERRLAPAEDEPLARLPHPDAPDLEDDTVGQCLGEAQPSWGSKASVPGERGVNWNSMFGVHESAMSRVKISKARAGDVLTCNETRICKVTVRARHAA
jgi:hypothetical protein